MTSVMGGSVDEMLDSYTNSAYHFIFEKLKKKLVEITNTLEKNN